MDFDIQSIFADPDRYFHAFGPESNLTFLAMNREHFGKSDHLDQRVATADGKAYRVPANPVMQAYQERGFVRPGLSYLYHTGQCGATQLARALDVPGKSLVFREPASLRQLGSIAGASFDVERPAQDFGPLLGFALKMLGKRYARFEPHVVKGAVPTALIAEAIDRADPERPAIMMYHGLADHLAAHLRTPEQAAQLVEYFDEMKIAQKPGFEEAADAPPPIKGAAIWLNLVQRFQALEVRNGRVRALNANRFYDQPVEAILAAATSFEVFVQAGDAKAAAKGLSKAPASEEFADDIAKARDWAAKKAADMGLRDKFNAEMIGDADALI